jgi:hypothetical protein
MEVRTLLLMAWFVITMSAQLTAQQQFMPVAGRVIGTPRAEVTTDNFIIYAPNESMAKQTAEAAERYRTELAMHWLGHSIDNWNSKCPIVVVAGDNLGASGETTFTPGDRTILNWRMRVQGSFERIIDSVLPHEITHTILATHFSQWNTPVPRWADEGASTTVEHNEERSKNDRMLVQFLRSGRGIPFATLFALEEYPADILPLYAQGYSLSIFLIGQGGPKKFVQFLEQGVQTDDWVGSIGQHYGYEQLGHLQVAWNKWVADGGGQVEQYTAANYGRETTQPVVLASANIPTGKLAIGRLEEEAISTIDDGFAPVQFQDNLIAAMPSDPPSMTASASIATSEPDARVAEANASTSSDSFSFQTIPPPEFRTRPSVEPSQGIGSSPASIQFGPAEALIR